MLILYSYVFGPHRSNVVVVGVVVLTGVNQNVKTLLWQNRIMSLFRSLGLTFDARL